MRKAKAIALAATRKHSIFYALYEAIKSAADMLYGTPKRTRITYIATLAMLALGMWMSMHDASAMAVCPV